MMFMENFQSLRNSDILSMAGIQQMKVERRSQRRQKCLSRTIIYYMHVSHRLHIQLLILEQTGAENPNPGQYNIESDSITLADAQMQGYTFKGWYADKECVGDPIRIIPANSTGNLNLYAKWNENHYTVIFHSNDSKSYSKEQSFAYSENIAWRK